VKKFLGIIIGIAIIGALLYAYQGPLQTLLMRLEGIYLPCEKPITYAIGSFDQKFGISKDSFLGALQDAEAAWEKPIARELFVEDPEGNLKINLIYDYRQEATEKLQKLGLTVGDNKASYDTLNAKYIALKAAYALDKAAFEAKAADFGARQDAYEKEVKSWNVRHGAPQDVYDRLSGEGEALKVRAAELNQLQDRLNEDVDTINALVTVLNRLVATLNLNVSKFNTVGETLGGEFEEGTYQSGPGGQAINIYQFEGREKLVRVLAHELGHALGLAHADDQNAIMYRLNNGINGTLTATDLAALKDLCGIR
jgi:hypothetical protein